MTKKLTGKRLREMVRRTIAGQLREDINGSGDGLVNGIREKLEINLNNLKETLENVMYEAQTDVERLASAIEDADGEIRSSYQVSGVECHDQGHGSMLIEYSVDGDIEDLPGGLNYTREGVDVWIDDEANKVVIEVTFPEIDMATIENFSEGVWCADCIPDSSATMESRRRGGRLVREDKWADGEEITQAYHIATIGGDDQDAADLAYEIYDRFTHNEMSVEDIIEEFGDAPAEAEPEAIGRDCKVWGESDGKVVTYDTFTGDIDIWELA